MSRDIEAPGAGGGVALVHLFACCSMKKTDRRRHLVAVGLRMFSGFVMWSKTFDYSYWGFSVAFSSFVRQMPRYTSLRRGTVRVNCVVLCTVCA